MNAGASGGGSYGASLLWQRVADCGSVGGTYRGRMREATHRFIFDIDIEVTPCNLLNVRFARGVVSINSYLALAMGCCKRSPNSLIASTNSTDRI